MDQRHVTVRGRVQDPTLSLLRCIQSGDLTTGHIDPDSSAGPLSETFVTDAPTVIEAQRRAHLLPLTQHNRE